MLQNIHDTLHSKSRSVSPHMRRCGTIGQPVWLMALTLSCWKTIHHLEKNNEEEKGHGKGQVRRWRGKQSSAVLYGFKRLFITMVSLSGMQALYPWRESNPCQTHLSARTWRNGPSWSCTGTLQATRGVLHPGLMNPINWSALLYIWIMPICLT